MRGLAGVDGHPVRDGCQTGPDVRRPVGRHRAVEAGADSAEQTAGLARGGAAPRTPSGAQEDRRDGLALPRGADGAVDDDADLPGRHHIRQRNAAVWTGASHRPVSSSSSFSRVRRIPGMSRAVRYGPTSCRVTWWPRSSTWRTSSPYTMYCSMSVVPPSPDTNASIREPGAGLSSAKITSAASATMSAADRIDSRDRPG